LNIKNIAISSVYVAIMWLLLKNGFDWYITNMTKMKVFYGVISSFPIFLFWIYANWIIVLSGIVLLSLMS
jgi:membrane protein